MMVLYFLTDQHVTVCSQLSPCSCSSETVYKHACLGPKRGLVSGEFHSNLRNYLQQNQFWKYLVHIPIKLNLLFWSQTCMFVNLHSFIDPRTWTRVGRWAATTTSQHPHQNNGGKMGCYHHLKTKIIGEDGLEPSHNIHTKILGVRWAAFSTSQHPHQNNGGKLGCYYHLTTSTLK